MRKNKTYNKKATKYQIRQKNKYIIIFFSVFLMCSLTDATIKSFFTKPTVNNITVTQNIEVKQEEKKLEIIEIKLTTEVPEVEFQIRTIAKEMGFKWEDYLVRLAYCESRLDPNGKNDKGNNPKTSVDRGLFQFNSHWQKKVSDECAYSIDCSTRKTIEMINKGQQGLWACDKLIK